MSGVRMLAASPMLMFLLSLLVASFFDTTAGQIGVCYGEKGNNLPSQSEVVAMYKQYNIQRMRMYDVNTRALDALRGSGIELILDIPNHKIADIARSQANANTWVQNSIKNYGDVRFRYISVGNELKPEYPAAKDRILIQAMENIDRALLTEAGRSIPVSTTTFMGAFLDTYPPSKGRFNDQYLTFLQPAIDFLVRKRYPLLVNIYTYFSYKDEHKDGKDGIPLEYALFTQTNGGVPDGPYVYQNLFDASHDSVYAALEKSRGGSLQVVVSESGWPSSGEYGASVGNATTYIKNLIQHVKKGSPKRQGTPIETYIFAMFDENDKPGDLTERHFGLFNPTDKKHKYVGVKFD